MVKLVRTTVLLVTEIKRFVNLLIQRHSAGTDLIGDDNFIEMLQFGTEIIMIMILIRN